MKNYIKMIKKKLIKDKLVIKRKRSLRSRTPKKDITNEIFTIER